jgi:hypothetical protein
LEKQRVSYSYIMEKQEFAQMMKAMLAETLEEMKADSKAWREEIRAETEATRARTKAMREERIKANMDACMADRKNDRQETTACQDAMEANLENVEPNPGLKEAVVERQETSNEEIAITSNSLCACREETMACQETMEARLEKEEPTSVEMKPEVAHEEVPLEDAVVMPVREPKEEELTEMAETTHRECEEPISADMKECQEMTVCHEATEADIEKMKPIDRAIVILEQMITMTKTNEEKIATMDLKGNPEEMECEEPASVEMKPEVAQQGVPREDAAVMPVRGLRKQRRGRKQAAGRREEPKKLNRGICHYGVRSGITRHI